MAWSANGSSLQMCEGDYGVAIPMKVRGVTLDAVDSVRVTIKTEKNGATVLTKEYSSISDNTVNFQLTAAETDKLPVGDYIYVLDWYRSGTFMYNLLPAATLKVVDKG